MARIQYQSEIAELVGKLAGSVFQYSYGGFQVHNRVVPANPQTERQQLRRGWFGWIAANWRTLTPTQQSTFITAAGSIAGGFRLFVQVNINLYLINVATLNSYPGASSPPSMPIGIDAYSTSLLVISATDALKIVPSGKTLLIYATYEKGLTKIFQNPSEYSPIVYFVAGTDLTSGTDITADWQTLFGILRGGRQVCIKSVLIDTANGSRGPEIIVCSPPLPPVGDFIINSNGDLLSNSNGDLLIWQ